MSHISILSTTGFKSKKESYHAAWASRILQEETDGILEKFRATLNEDDLAKVANTAHLRKGTTTTKTKFKVGIIGAGAAGLFTAMLFDHFAEISKPEDFEVEYEILEANGEERLGGRLFTYKFPNKPGQPEVGDNEYFDVGAMRFPDLSVMNRTFALFKYLEMDKVDQEVQQPKQGDLIKYYMKGEGVPLLYNGVQTVGDQDPTAFDFNVPIDRLFQKASLGYMVSSKIAKFTDSHKKDGEEAFWKKLMDEGDSYTPRQWLRKFYDFPTIEFLETFNYGDGWYNQALSEMVLETIDFGDEKTKWHCVQGGAQVIARKMFDKLKHPKNVHFEKVVTEMSYMTDEKSYDPDDRKVLVTVKGEAKPRVYDAVFNSAPLGAMQRMRLEGLNLNWHIKSAIRSLGYGASCKVGIRFRSLWWIKKYDIGMGGVAKTDLPIRCCVYPSYNTKYSDDYKQDRPGVLLASYCWSMEAERLSALIDRKSPDGEEELKEVLFHDLARLHTKSDKEYKELYQFLKEDYLDHFAYNWYADPSTTGAFAYFGPTQFRNMFPGLVNGGGGKHIIIGEAASAHHAWVVGALESAVRGVYQFMYRHSEYNPEAKKIAEQYARGEIMDGLWGPLPAEFDALHPLDADSAKKDSDTKQKFSKMTANAMDKGITAHGDLARLLVLAEEVRLRQDTDRLTKVSEDQLPNPLKWLIGR